jgi:hypothetical protein
MKGAGLTIDCEPLVQILAFREFDCLFETSASERGFGELPQLVAAIAFVRPLWFELASRAGIAKW